MTHLVGIDPSTKLLAFVGLELDEHGGIVAVTPLLLSLGKDTYSPAKLVRARYAAREFLDMLNPEPSSGHCYIEAPVQGRGGMTSTFKQCFVSAIVQEQFHRAGWTVELVPSSEWKRNLGVRGRTTEQTKASARERLEADWPDLWSAVSCTYPGRDGASQDLVDAGGVALLGRGRLLALRHMGEEGRMPAQAS